MALVLLNPHARGGRAAQQLPVLENWLHVHAPDCQASRAVTMLATLTAAIDRLTAPVKSDGLNPDVRSGATFIVAS